MTAEMRRLVFTLLGQASLLAWCYWTTLQSAAGFWATDPQHVQGYCVIAFAAFLLWARRDRFPERPLQGNWRGAAVVALAVVLRLAAARYSLEAIEMASLIPCVAGCFLVLGGWSLLRWAWPAVLLLIFLLPLPSRIETALTGPLRSIARSGSLYSMQTLGLPAVAENNIILVDESNIRIVEACSGLGMIITLFALTTTVIFAFPRESWQKPVILFSALPIALLANVIRITLTGVLSEFWGSHVADMFFHDLASWVMIPVALAILWFELFILDNLFFELDTSPGSFRIFGLSANSRARSKIDTRQEGEL